MLLVHTHAVARIVSGVGQCLRPCHCVKLGYSDGECILET